MPTPQKFRNDNSRLTGSTGLEVWGGVESSMVHVRGVLRDQFRETGHYDRLSDIAAVAEIGIRKLRYTAAWERIAPDSPMDRDWEWQDERMAELRRHGISPILGLVHHGSGPSYTCLSDPEFPELLAQFAGSVARRYPWVQDWTPVNEPVTTARFSGLYGLWSPHEASETAFLRMLAIECRGVMLAMRAIREVIPGARLVQTEDLGRNFSTARLKGLAEHYNQRRWLSFDLLLGRVDRAHPWHTRFLEAGIPQSELDEFLGEPRGPMLLGINHYATSDRFLDHRTGLYPAHLSDPNAPGSFVDTEAVRALVPVSRQGWLPRLREAWQRYPEVPLAVTEVHLGCTPDEQVRWLHDCWTAANTLRAEGADLQGMTVWSMFGAVDWCSLLTGCRDRYEPGVFDSRAPGGPRLTPLGEAVASLARNGRLDHPALGQPGWWRREDRLHEGLRKTG